jgi:hypothetical protein
MAYELLQWPDTVYPGEVQSECPDALPVIDALLRNIQTHGPSPDGYQVKNLGQRMSGLWQINLRVRNQQVRVLYAPYDKQIVLFRIHKKTSPQEQMRAYDLGQKRKREFEAERNKQKSGKPSNAQLH